MNDETMKHFYKEAALAKKLKAEFSVEWQAADFLISENARLQAELDAVTDETLAQFVEIETLKAQLDAANLALAGAREALTIAAEMGCQFDLDGNCEDFLELNAYCHVCRCQAALDKLPNNSKLEAFAESLMEKKVELCNCWVCSAVHKLQNLPTPAKAPDLTRIAACVKALRLAEIQYLGCGGNLKDSEIVSAMRAICQKALESLTPEDHAWVERVGGV
jgi:hypothetical protein